MYLHSPVFIGPRLRPSLKLGDATLSIDYSDRPGRQGRTRYTYALDLADGREYEGNDLESGFNGGTLQEGFVSFLSFMAHAAESYGYRLSHPELSADESSFPEWIEAWAFEHSDAIESAALDLEDNPRAIDER
jgi:hypothetical protein